MTWLPGDDWSTGALLVLHVVAAVTAVGSVLATDAVNAFAHLRPHAAPTVVKQQPLLSLGVWASLLVLAVTGTLLFLEDPELVHEGQFQLKMLLVLAVFLNGVVLNVWVAPRFERLSGEWDDQTPRVRRFTRIAGVAAAISLVGWYATFIVAWLDG